MYLVSLEKFTTYSMKTASHFRQNGLLRHVSPNCLILVIKKYFLSSFQLTVGSKTLWPITSYLLFLDIFAQHL